MHRTFVQRLAYDILRVLARLVSVWFFRLRVAGRENWPVFMDCLARNLAAALVANARATENAAPVPASVSADKAVAPASTTTAAASH